MTAPAAPEPDASSRVTEVYRHTDSNLLLHVAKKTKKIVGRKSEEVAKLLETKSVQDLIDAGELVSLFVARRRPLIFVSLL